MKMTLDEFLAEWNSDSAYINVHTSGSTGTPKVMSVEKTRMANSARATCSFLNLEAGNTALLCMPLDYIAGKMMVVRSIVCNLRLISVSPSGHPLAGMTEAPDFAAMVPMQVYNSLRVPQERDILMKIKHLIIGGGAVDEELEGELGHFPNAVWSTYGMTETLSHIALRRLNGAEADSWYTPFSDVKLCADTDGCLIIDAPSVHDGVLKTNDIVEFAVDGQRFHVLGRKDNVINSGGIKIHIEGVERMLRQHISVPYAVTKKKDAKFGEIVVLLVQTEDIIKVRETCTAVLPEYWQPRLYLSVKSIPFTDTGKIARAAAEKIAASR